MSKKKDKEKDKKEKKVSARHNGNVKAKVTAPPTIATLEASAAALETASKEKEAEEKPSEVDIAEREALIAQFNTLAAEEAVERDPALDMSDLIDRDKIEKAAEDASLVEDRYEEDGKLKKKFYEKELERLQIELVKLQEWVKAKGLRVVVVFEGRDAAGKGGVIKRITESLNPRVARVVALGVPTDREKSQWYFQRYVAHLPAAGEIVLFDRSWYNRAGVERVMGFCTEDEYQEFLRSTPEFERMLLRSGIILIKYWFSVSDEEQEHRFQDRINDPTKRWKLSPMDVNARSRWVEYSIAKDQMFKYTDTKQSPWWVVNADDKKRARLNCISHLLSMIPYQDLTPEPIKLPARQKDIGYVRMPFSDQTFVPEKY